MWKKKQSAVVAVGLLCLALAASALPVQQSEDDGDNIFAKIFGLSGQGVNGGINCAGCTLGVALVDKLADYNNQTVADVVAEACDYAPEALREPCAEVVRHYGPYVIDFLAQKLSADEVCFKLSFCKPDEGHQQCRLFTQSPASMSNPSLLTPVALPRLRANSVWSWIVDKVNRVFDSHEPLLDFDNDLHSTASTLRGSSWRGKDCNDFKKDVYPGRKPDHTNPTVDHNCNGIYGADQAGQAYEETLCGSSRPMGTVILGDSAAAHFHIPPQFLDAREIHKGTYKQFITILENEFDWPEQSSTTAYETSPNPDCPGPVTSIYEKMLARNRCNHRDFQNIAVNGARSGAMNKTIVRSLQRDQQNDNPALVFYALIGNDVCNGHPDYWNRMTTPEEFEASVTAAMEYLDTQLPLGSHVVFTGLADGRVLYDSMHAREHPIGGTTYAALYDYLNCLEISPCLVWMNTNSTIRDAGSARAAELNQVYRKIISEYKYKNFDMEYYDFPFEEVQERWTKQGGEVWQLIEPVDGFHPNQVSMALTAEVTWDKLLADHPDWLGPINEHNDEIVERFGDQGGY